jgi:hypothetical protein
MRKIRVRFDHDSIPGSELCRVTTVINGFVIGEQTFVTVDAAAVYEEMILLLFDPDAKYDEESA